VVAVRKAGLKPVLCDVTLKDFNADSQALLQAISPHTLAVVAVHMFGIPISDIAQWRQRIPPEVWFIEDCAQAMGSRINDSTAGSFGDISFFSFSRGKNFSTFGGGCITTCNEDLSKEIELEVARLASQRRAQGQLLWLIIVVYLFATNPYIYGLGHRFIRCFKQNAPPKDFTPAALGIQQAGLGVYLFPRSQQSFLARYRNGMFLLNGLKETAGIRLPKISPCFFAVFNRLPILFEDIRSLEYKERELWKAGFETSRMYIRPLHQMFELGYKKEEFPNANYLAKHLLALPVYSAFGKTNMEKMLEVIKK
jgi:dTDP-4-amino-4,6-dideoxygalactose transaminase